MIYIPVAKLPAFWGTAVCSGHAGSARVRSPRRRPRTTLRSDRAGERSDHPVTSGRSSCECNDATAVPSRFHQAPGCPAMRGSGRRLPRTWHLQNDFTFITCRFLVRILCNANKSTISVSFKTGSQEINTKGMNYLHHQQTVQKEEFALKWSPDKISHKISASRECCVIYY